MERSRGHRARRGRTVCGDGGSSTTVSTKTTNYTIVVEPYGPGLIYRRGALVFAGGGDERAAGIANDTGAVFGRDAGAGIWGIGNAADGDVAERDGAGNNAGIVCNQFEQRGAGIGCDDDALSGDGNGGVHNDRVHGEHGDGDYFSGAGAGGVDGAEQSAGIQYAGGDAAGGIADARDTKQRRGLDQVCIDQLRNVVVPVERRAGSIGAGATAAVTVTANPAGLSAGYYWTDVSIVSSAGSAIVPVTLLIAANGTITLGPAGAEFTLPQGGAAVGATSFR